ncbi:MAG: hypothetical protein WAM91_16115 [Candidatus Acidiferrales bacterium]
MTVRADVVSDYAVFKVARIALVAKPDSIAVDVAEILRALRLGLSPSAQKEHSGPDQDKRPHNNHTVADSHQNLPHHHLIGDL